MTGGLPQRIAAVVCAVVVVAVAVAAVAEAQLGNWHPTSLQPTAYFTNELPVRSGFDEARNWAWGFWDYEPPRNPNFTIANGMAYLSIAEEMVVVLLEEKEEVWTLPLSQKTLSSVVLGFEGDIYFTADRTTYRVNRWTGAKIQSHDCAKGALAQGPPTLGPNGELIVVCSDATMTVYDSTGLQVATMSVGSASAVALAPATISPDGTLVCVCWGSRPASVQCWLTSDYKTRVLSKSLQTRPCQAPVSFDPHGNVYALRPDGYLMSWTATGVDRFQPVPTLDVAQWPLVVDTVRNVTYALTDRQDGDRASELDVFDFNGNMLASYAYNASSGAPLAVDVASGEIYASLHKQIVALAISADASQLSPVWTIETPDSRGGSLSLDADNIYFTAQFDSDTDHHALYSFKRHSKSGGATLSLNQVSEVKRNVRQNTVHVAQIVIPTVIGAVILLCLCCLCWAVIYYRYVRPCWRKLFGDSSRPTPTPGSGSRRIGSSSSRGDGGSRSGSSSDGDEESAGHNRSGSSSPGGSRLHTPASTPSRKGGLDKWKDKLMEEKRRREEKWRKLQEEDGDE